MADLVGEFQKPRKNGVREKPADWPSKTEVQENGRRVRGEMDPLIGGSNYHENGEEIDAPPPKRSRQISKETIRIPGGHTFSTSELQNVVSMAELGIISNAIGRNWRFLGHELDLKESEIDRCEESHPNNAQRQIYEMLKVWKASKLEKATIYVLLKGLREHKGTVDWENIDDVVYNHVQMRRRETSSL